MGCATEDCGNPDCPVCSIARVNQRFTPQLFEDERADLKKDAPALNGTKGRPSRDPHFIKRRRKPL